MGAKAPLLSHSNATLRGSAPGSELAIQSADRPIAGSLGLFHWLTLCWPRFLVHGKRSVGSLWRLTCLHARS